MSLALTLLQSILYLLRVKRYLSCLDPLHPKIIMHILHTVLCTFPEFYQGEFVKPSRASLVSDNFLYSRGLKI